MAIVVRRAAPSDVEWLLTELKEFAAFVDMGIDLAKNEEYSRTQLLNIVERHFCLVADDEGKPVGLLAAYDIAHPFDPHKRFLSEQFWWVTPKARGGRAGLMLLNAYREKCAEVFAQDGIAAISLEAQSPINQKSLEKRGFRLTERTFIYDPAPSATVMIHNIAEAI